MGSWSGHSPVTTEALLDIFDRHSHGDGGPTVKERLLYTTCDIWAAISTRCLASRLAPDPESGLLIAAPAFAAIGASRAARILSQGAADCATAGTVRVLRARIAAIEVRVESAGDPIDELIARFAADRLRERERAQGWTNAFFAATPDLKLI